MCCCSHFIDVVGFSLAISSAAVCLATTLLNVGAICCITAPTNVNQPFAAVNQAGNLAVLLPTLITI